MVSIHEPLKLKKKKDGYTCIKHLENNISVYKQVFPKFLHFT